MSSVIAAQVQGAIHAAALAASDTLVVGLSGGVDSQVLTRALADLARQGTGPRIVAVHVDHGLRPESGRDAERVVEAGRRIGVPVDVVRVDVRAWDRVLRQGTESAARAARYAALAASAREHGARWVAVGHTMNDQAETMLLRLARGTSLDGLAGMRLISRRAVALEPSGESVVELALLRPLLGVSRAEVEREARAHDIEPVEDPSNRALIYHRNLVRHQAIPAMRAVNHDAVLALARTAGLLRDDADYLAGQARDAEHEILSAGDGLVWVARDPLRRLHPAIQRRVLTSAIGGTRPWPPRLTADRVEALRAAVLDGEVSTRTELGGGLAAYIDYEAAALGVATHLEDGLRRASGLPLLEPGRVIALDAEVELPLGNGWTLSASRRAGGGHWFIRTRRPGDRIEFPGGPAVRLQDWFVNRKVALYVRDWLPLVEGDGLIRWVGGVSSDTFEDNRAGVLVRVTRGSGRTTA